MKRREEPSADQVADPDDHRREGKWSRFVAKLAAKHNVKPELAEIFALAKRCVTNLNRGEGVRGLVFLSDELFQQAHHFVLLRYGDPLWDEARTLIPSFPDVPAGVPAEKATVLVVADLQ